MPHTFTDNAGRVWEIRLNTFTHGKVFRECGVWLADAMLIRDATGNLVPSDLLKRLLGETGSDLELLSNVIYSLAESQCEERHVTREQFETEISDDKITEAMEAVLYEIGGFFPSPAMRSVFLKAVEAWTTALRLGTDRVTKAVRELDAFQLARSVNGSVGNTEESSGSIPESTRSANCA